MVIIKMKPKIVWQLKRLMDRTSSPSDRHSIAWAWEARRITPSFGDSVIYHAVIIALEPYLINRFSSIIGSIPERPLGRGLNKSEVKDNRKTKYCLQE